MKAFDAQFNEFLEFMPDGLQVISRIAFAKDEVKKLYDKEFKADISLDNIKEAYVRWQPTPLDLRDEGLGNFCWLSCEEKDKNAQPVWFCKE